MIMRPTWQFTVLLLVASMSAVAFLWAEELLSKDDALVQVFPKPMYVVTKWVAVSSNQVKKIRISTDLQKVSPVFKYYEASSNEVIVGYAVIDSTLGKHGPIRFMVVLKPDLTIKSVSILAFHEKRGRPVRRRSFLSQFAGKTMSDQFRVHSDIQAITGATVSSRAVASGAKSVVAYITVLVRDKEDSQKEGDE